MKLQPPKLPGTRTLKVIIKKAAHNGGDVAGKARLDLEKKSGRKVSSRQNFKEITERELRKSIGKK